MRIRIAYATTYRYASRARAVLQVLRLSPRSDSGQHVADWRVDADVDARLRSGEDALGNRTHCLSVDQPIDRLMLEVVGDVETTDTHGVLSGAVERFPPAVFLRETPLTAADPALRAFAEGVAAGAGTDPLTRLHALMAAVREQIAFGTDATVVATTASDAYALRRGVCQDMTHVFLACARHLGIPARYVSGHLARIDGVVLQDAGHAWAEAFAPRLGWVGFDTTNGVSPGERHVRVAIGLDYLGAAPVRGSRVGGGSETMSVALSVEVIQA